MVELIPAVCPQCGGELQVPEQLEKVHCMYCGTKFIVDKKVDKHIHYHLKEAAFTCEVCGRRKTFDEYSGVAGRTVCMDCYYEARNRGWMIWGVGILLVLAGIFALVIGGDVIPELGFALFIIGLLLTIAGRFFLKGG